MKKDNLNKKKNKKTFMIVIGTMIMGWVIPSFIKITDVKFVDKLVFSVVFSVCLNVATLIVSLCFAVGIFRDNKKKEKKRLSVYLILVAIISCVIATILSFIPKGNPLFILVVVSIAIISIFVQALKFDDAVKQVKTKMNPFTKSIDLNSMKDIDERIFIRKPKTLFELWNEHGDNNGSLFVVNGKSKGIEWVEITKRPYPKVIVYANVKWLGEETPKYQEVIDAEKKIWYTT